jgi:outer membrane murein-binding lipoprotein Lpp
MAIFKRASSQALVLGGLLLAGCAEGGDNIFTTGSLNGQDAKTDPACVTLASNIEALRKEGVADKIEKAAAKRYKMTQADLKKADQLTKANADFQGRCSTVTPKATTTAEAPADTSKAAPARKTAKAKTP